MLGGYFFHLFVVAFGRILGSSLILVEIMGSKTWFFLIVLDEVDRIGGYL